MNNRTKYSEHQNVNWLSVPGLAGIFLLTALLLAGAPQPKLPTEAPWLVLSLILILLFSRFLSQRLKLLIAACGLLAGLTHRALIEAFPKSRLTFTDWCHAPGDYTATYLAIAAAAVMWRCSGHWPKQNPEPKPKEPDLLVMAAAAKRFIGTRCAPFAATYPFLTLSLFSSLILVLLFVQFDYAKPLSAVAVPGRFAIKTEEAPVASAFDERTHLKEAEPEEVYKAWKTHSPPISPDSRRRLVNYLTQRVDELPWRLDLVWDLYAARRSDGYRIQVPTPQAIGLVLIGGLLIYGLPRIHRRAALKRQALFQQVRRIAPVLGQIIRTIVFDATSDSPQSHTRISKGRR